MSDQADNFLNRPDVKRALAAVAFAREARKEAEKLEPLTRDELKEHLRHLAINQHDAEQIHLAADMFLLRYIADDEVRQLFLDLKRWYS